MKKISKTQYERGVDEYYENLRLEKTPYVRQLRLGLWEVYDGKNTIVTGVAGYNSFNQALRKAVNEEIQKIKRDINETH